ncbi:Peptidyl-tRNA hydrolase protein 2, mitochondrial [Cyanidiococcus yangmingshanensis]|uniref:peptidyl-tRNA hydrolase n=1 Tax=Cyanidiococcus yangmingshanensis TaxID=2690220 RepID=A0A7J7IIA8_9RHOD|nr:Peptidyl-tRNA hydrolase protein 2, mitochondrial [Cyanidiococcus yangmingshanensis]
MATEAVWPVALVGFLVGFLVGRQRRRGVVASSGTLVRQQDVIDAGPLLVETSTAADGKAGFGAGATSSPDDVKLVLVVRRDLKMTPGKIAAQCGHASVGAYKACNNRNTLLAWERNGQPKIALRCSSLKELLAIERAAQQQRVPSFAVRDAGRTQIAAGTITVLALGPAEGAKIQRITGHLKLL